MFLEFVKMKLNLKPYNAIVNPLRSEGICNYVGTGAERSCIQPKACSVAYCNADAALSNNPVKRSTLSCVAVPQPERMETDAAKPPASCAFAWGDTRYLPTANLS